MLLNWLTDLAFSQTGDGWKNLNKKKGLIQGYLGNLSNNIQYNFFLDVLIVYIVYILEKGPQSYSVLTHNNVFTQYLTEWKIKSQSVIKTSGSLFVARENAYSWCLIRNLLLGRKCLNFNVLRNTKHDKYKSPWTEPGCNIYK